MKKIKVAIGIIIDKKNNLVYVSRRPIHKHLGGLYEFPGGKIEKGENAKEALKREMHEELGIDIGRYVFLIKKNFYYPTCFAKLYFFLIKSYLGTPIAKENQEILKIRISQLKNLEMPEVNKSIIDFLIMKYY